MTEALSIDPRVIAIAKAVNALDHNQVEAVISIILALVDAQDGDPDAEDACYPPGGFAA